MKIESIQLENFGLYGSKLFRFEGQPLILIYGANETGKTTALNGLRQALFGFPRQSAYITGKTMGAEATLTLADGRRVRFARQKKNANGFTATIDGKLPLSENDWASLTSGLDLKAYQSLFGFSLDELRSGEKALAQTPIENALSSSGFGGLARLQKVQNRINEFLSQSLKRVGVSGEINAKLAEIEAAERHLESVLTLPADVSELRSRVTTAQQEASRFQTELAQLREQASACQRQQAALPRASEYRQVQQSLAQFDLPAALDHDYRVQWSVLNNRLAGARGELAAELTKLEQLEMELASLPKPEGNAAFQAEVIELGKLARQVPLWRQQIQHDLRDATELENELSDALRKLGWSRQDTRWRSLRLDLNQQAEVNEATQSLDVLSRKLNDCRTRIDVAEKQLHMHRAPQATAGQPPAGLSWDRIVEIESQLRVLRPLAHQLDHLTRQLEQLGSDRRQASQTDELLRLTRELSLNTEIELPGNWSVPALSQLNEQQQCLTSARHDVARLEAEAKRLNDQLTDCQQQIVSLKTGTGIKSLAELEAIWCQRDQVVSHWREELRTPLLASSVTPTEYDERLAQLNHYHEQSDSAVRAMLADMKRSAELASRERELVQLKQQMTRGNDDHQTALTKLAAAQAQWIKLWANCPLAANWSAAQNAPSAERTIKWLELYGKWQVHQSSIDELAREVERARVARVEGWQALTAMWSGAKDCKSLGEAEQLVARWRSSMATADAHASLMKELEQTHQSHVGERQSIEQQLAQQQHVFQQAIATLGLPETWPTSELNSRLERLKQCQTLAQRVDKLRQREQETSQRLNAFADRVTDLGARMGVGTINGASEEAAALWLEQFTHSEQADHRRLELARLIAAQRAAKDKRLEQVSQLEASIQEMVVRLGATSPEQVQTWTDKATTVFQLRAKEAELRAALESNAGGRPLEQFLAELAELEPRMVAANSATLAAKLSSLDSAASAAQQQIGGMARELEFKEQGSAALEAEQQLKRLRAELVELSEQWVVHKLAGELLEQTIDRFTRDHEPQLIKHTRRFFRELTDGRYGVVEHDSGKHGGFAVRDNHGNPWQPDKLSTGTREQLYLAIRLAYITHFNETHEPLPVIMDDCFVNFDDTRARIALRTLIHWQESVQTILLSCHWRSVEALAELAPETPVITIANGELTTARHLAERQLSVL